MTNYILIYSLISFLTLVFISKISYKFNLVDIPDKRKKHYRPTAYSGGIALSFVYIISIFLFDVISEKLNLILSLAFLIAIVGLIDDKYQLNTGSKLSIQIIPIIYLIFIENFTISQIGDYGFFKLQLNSFSIPFSLLAVLFLINSFNYFDGLDGTLSFSAISVLGILYFLTQNTDIKLFLITILLPLFFFLCFNFSILKLPKLFLGDSGSLLLGFIIAFTLIYLESQQKIHPILLAWSIAVFVYEFLSINLIRLKYKKALFKAGQDHLHHILFNKNKSLFLTNLSIVTINIALFLIGYITFEFIGAFVSLILFIISFIIFFLLRDKLYKNI